MNDLEANGCLTKLESANNTDHDCNCIGPDKTIYLISREVLQGRHGSDLHSLKYKRYTITLGHGSEW